MNAFRHRSRSSAKSPAQTGATGSGVRRVMIGLLLTAAALGFAAFLSNEAAAQVPSLDKLIPSGDGTATGRIIQLVALITVLSVAPGLLIMVTCFTRFVVALSFLRAGLGLLARRSIFV